MAGQAMKINRILNSTLLFIWFRGFPDIPGIRSLSYKINTSLFAWKSVLIVLRTIAQVRDGANRVSLSDMWRANPGKHHEHHLLRQVRHLFLIGQQETRMQTVHVWRYMSR